jgi:hypothetical protein
MDRTTIVVGNGLGLALDKDYFTLTAAMDKSWATLDPEAQTIIKNLCKNKEKPKSETDLSKIQEVIFALKTLKGYEKDWPCLDQKACDFLQCYQKYILEIGKHFFNYKVVSSENCEKFRNFADDLCRFVEGSGSRTPHIVTLNYDKILYSYFIKKGLVKGYDGRLCDGIWGKKGFARSNLIRKPGKTFGWYLHLHGSPLFYSNGAGNNIRKNSISDDLVMDEDQSRDHLVLTHFKYKPAVISKSTLLAAYWDYFSLALQESNRTILLGYSGCDAHVNDAIKEWQKGENGRKIEIVEWERAGNAAGREKYWQKILGPLDRKNLTLTTQPSILDYRFSG